MPAIRWCSELEKSGNEHWKWAFCPIYVEGAGWFGMMKNYQLRFCGYDSEAWCYLEHWDSTVRPLLLVRAFLVVTWPTLPPLALQANSVILWSSRCFMSIHFLLCSAISSLVEHLLPATPHPAPSWADTFPALAQWIPGKARSIFCSTQGFLLAQAAAARTRLWNRAMDITQKTTDTADVNCQSCLLPSVVSPLCLWVCVQEMACINANRVFQKCWFHWSCSVNILMIQVNILTFTKDVINTSTNTYVTETSLAENQQNK